MGYNHQDSVVRGDLFNPSGKWKYSVAIDMTGFYSGLLPRGLSVHDAVRKAVQTTDSKTRGVIDSAVQDGSGYTLIVLEPYHQYSHPVMIVL